MKEKKVAAVQAEIAAERAAALGLSAQRLKKTLEALRRADSGTARAKPRAQLVHDAANACLAYLVQREALGFGAHDAAAVRKEYAVPDEVWNGMGRLS